MFCFVLASLTLQRAELTSDVPIYLADKTVAEQHISLKPWGGGSLTESKWVVLHGKQSLRLQASSFFQGGTMEFATPIDLSKVYADRSKFLRLDVFVESRGVVRSSPAKSVVVGGKAHLNYRYPQKPVLLEEKVTKLRLLLTTTNGERAEIYLPLGVAKAATTHGWRTVAVPLSAIRGLGKSNMQISKMFLAPDSKGIVYLSDIDIANDSLPITLDAKPETANVNTKTSVLFSAIAEGGLTPIKYEWDFDDRDGMHLPDSEQQSVRHRFSQPGTYNVTVKAVDRYGVKSPVSKRIVIHVTA